MNEETGKLFLKEINTLVLKYCDSEAALDCCQHFENMVLDNMKVEVVDMSGRVNVYPARAVKQHDSVHSPSHYQGEGGMECIEAIMGSMSPEGFQDYCKGNILKYIWRFRNKGGVEDLKKAGVYLDFMISSAEDAAKEEGGQA